MKHLVKVAVVKFAIPADADKSSAHQTADSRGVETLNQFAYVQARLREGVTAVETLKRAYARYWETTYRPFSIACVECFDGLCGSTSCRPSSFACLPSSSP